MSSWIVLCAQVITSDDHWDIVYNFDHKYFSAKDDAIRHGFNIRGSDDFNVALVKSKRVTKLFWMDEEMEDKVGLAAINEQHSFSA